MWQLFIRKDEPGIGGAEPIDWGNLTIETSGMTACGDAQASMAKPADQPITVPAITLEGDANGAPHPDASSYARKFSGSYAHRIITGGVGHNVPQEAPQAFAQAIVDVDGY
jgi:pimeloyl-ACP methyl ester carboxylesterase